MALITLAEAAEIAYAVQNLPEAVEKIAGIHLGQSKKERKIHILAADFFNLFDEYKEKERFSLPHNWELSAELNGVEFFCITNDPNPNTRGEKVK